MLGVGCEMMDVECGILNGACGTGMFSHRSQLDTETMRVALSKNTDFTDAHGFFRMRSATHLWKSGRSVGDTMRRWR